MGGAGGYKIAVGGERVGAETHRQRSRKRGSKGFSRLEGVVTETKSA